MTLIPSLVAEATEGGLSTDGHLTEFMLGPCMDRSAEAHLCGRGGLLATVAVLVGVEGVVDEAVVGVPS